MKRDLDELTVGPPNIRLASLSRLRSSVETNWAEILTHIALDLGDKLGVCMLHKVLSILQLILLQHPSVFYFFTFTSNSSE